MKITAYQINGQTLGVDIFQWDNADLNGNPAFKAEDTVSDGYVDISSAAVYTNYGSSLKKDFKWIRRQLQGIDFATATADEKIIIAQYRATNEANCIATLSSADYIKYSTDFDLKSQDCRNIRLSNAKSILFANVSLMDRYTILGFLQGTPLLNNYLTQGIEGTVDGDPIEGLFNYVEATPGGSFAATGIAAQTPTMIGTLTIAQTVTKMMDCLRNGNY